MRIDSVDGMIKAAAAPITARQAMSCHMAVDKVAKPGRHEEEQQARVATRPFARSGRPARPVVNSRPAKTSE